MNHKLNASQQIKVHNIYKIKAILSRLFPNANHRFDAEWFNKHIDKNPPYPRFLYNKTYYLRYEGKQETNNHHYSIEAALSEAINKLEDIIKKVYKDDLALTAIWNKRQENNYKDFGFNSQAEVAISIELSNRRILFFSNPICLIYDRHGTGHRKKPDFLVVYKGQTRILEVDGKDFHENAFDDYKRDRMFQKYGLQTTRFTADECLTNPAAVVEEFLELFDNGSPSEYKLEEILNHYHNNIKNVQL